jgi:hypothetical protein
MTLCRLALDVLRRTRRKNQEAVTAAAGNATGNRRRKAPILYAQSRAGQPAALSGLPSIGGLKKRIDA